MITCSKRFEEFPFAHRQPAHPGHCHFVHGHNWTFEFTFGCLELEPETGFVIDFGALKWVREWLTSYFDHTLVLNHNDPLIAELSKMPSDQLAWNLRFVPNCGCEGLAKFAFEYVDRELRKRTFGRAFLVSVRLEEDSKNYSTYSQ